MDLDAPTGQQGRQMLENRLRRYLYWKARLSARSVESQPPSAAGRQSPPGDDELNLALRKKDRDRVERSANRRRVRGGASGTVSTRAQGQDQVPAVPNVEDGILAELYV
jgi:DNA excision repair protein ERCC-4